MLLKSFKELSELRKKFKDKKIIFCSGVFDLTHAGHILFFEDCKEFGDLLVVGIATDKAIKTYKGDKRPILNENIRLKTIDSLTPVDYCFLHDLEGDNSLDIIRTIFKNLNPDVYVINEDASDISYRKKIAEEENVNIIILNRSCPKEFDKISTTKIIDKIRKLFLK